MSAMWVTYKPKTNGRLRDTYRIRGAVGGREALQATVRAPRNTMPITLEVSKGTA